MGQLWQVCHRFLPRIAGVTLCKEWLLEKLLLLSSPHSGGYSLTRLALSNAPKLSSPQCGGYSPKLRPSTQKISFLPRNAGVTLRGLLFLQSSESQKPVAFSSPHSGGYSIQKKYKLDGLILSSPHSGGYSAHTITSIAKIFLSSPHSGGYSLTI